MITLKYFFLLNQTYIKEMRSGSSNDIFGDVDSDLDEAGSDGEADEGAVETAHPGRDAHAQAPLTVAHVAQECPLTNQELGIKYRSD